MKFSKRRFIGTTAIAAAGLAAWNYSKWQFLQADSQNYDVPESLQREMYEKAIALAKSKIRGGAGDPVFKQAYVDAAFSSNIFYWDTCFIACYAKYHQDELPIINALDNFYNLMDSDGSICREYTSDGKPFWPKEHPVSMNPPLLAFAELELYSIHQDKARLTKVFPYLVKHFDYWVKTCRGDDQLFFGDGLATGMDNIDRFPEGWQDDHQGIALKNLYPELFDYNWTSSKWNQQGRLVDTSAQMALFAKNMIEIAGITNQPNEVEKYAVFYQETKNAINKLCWNEDDGFYYDLGYSKQIRRKHIGMFWVLFAEIIPPAKVDKFLAHLTDPEEFWRKIPVATTPANEKGFSPKGEYWKGSVWAPTNYMILKGLAKYQKTKIADQLAKQYYWAVAEVYKQTGTFWENYAPDFLEKGSSSRPDFCGWTGIVPIAVYNEYIKK